MTIYDNDCGICLTEVDVAGINRRWSVDRDLDAVVWGCGHRIHLSCANQWMASTAPKICSCSRPVDDDLLTPLKARLAIAFDHGFLNAPHLLTQFGILAGSIATGALASIIPLIGADNALATLGITTVASAVAAGALSVGYNYNEVINNCFMALGGSVLIPVITWGARMGILHRAVLDIASALSTEKAAYMISSAATAALITSRILVSIVPGEAAHRAQFGISSRRGIGSRVVGLLACLHSMYDVNRYTTGAHIKDISTFYTMYPVASMFLGSIIGVGVGTPFFRITASSISTIATRLGHVIGNSISGGYITGTLSATSTLLQSAGKTLLRLRSA